jgi:hypothetical protein
MIGDSGPSALFKYQPERLPSGPTSSYGCGDSPLCAWVGRSFVVFVACADVPGGLDELAALTPSFVSAMTTGAR